LPEFVIIEIFTTSNLHYRQLLIPGIPTFGKRVAREQCFPVFPPLGSMVYETMFSQKNVSCFVHLWETRLENNVSWFVQLREPIYSLGNNVFCFAQLWETIFSWFTQLWETCPENNVSWFVQL
jgi:hypothetical protein